VQGGLGQVLAKATLRTIPGANGLTLLQ